LVHVGNSHLKSGIEYNTTLNYRHADKYTDITVGLLCSLDHHPITKFYSASTDASVDYLLSRNENARSLLQYGGVVSGQVNLFNQKLSVQLYAIALEQELRGREGYRLNNFYLPVAACLSYTDKHWGTSYQFNIPTKELQNSLLVTGENCSYFDAYYQWSGFRVSASCFWLLTKSKYKSEITNNPVIEAHSKSWIDDNRSMVTLGFSWNFSTGKRKEESAKVLNNAFGDKVAF
jgi:hypothetical protein